ncbi:uncharacterized protein [Leptinotarsa decemlineata]|uniref:uncharacterized protein n=1 Tax=Leptinotarsa decemlineata TaxID=7539 RepID=UPI003D30A313
MFRSFSNNFKHVKSRQNGVNRRNHFRYRRKELLWNPFNPLFHTNLREKDAWKRVSELFRCKEGYVKKKIDSLLTSFRRGRQMSYYYSGAGTEDIHKSNWFAFKHLQFLMNKFTPRKTIDSSSSVTPGSPDEVRTDTLDDSHIDNIVPEGDGNTAEQVRHSQREVQPQHISK